MEHPEWTLSCGKWRATVSPLGASLRRLWVEGDDGPRDILWGYSGTAGKRGGQGDVLLPFPGRIRGGTYSLAGRRHQLDCNDKEGPNAIHGFVRGRLWDGAQDGASAGFATRILPDGQPGYPFTLDVKVRYTLAPGGLACAFTARNTGDAVAPFGAGFHPYVATAGGVDAALLEVPAARLVEFDGLLPTGRVVEVPPGLDFRRPRRVGPARLNHCLTALAADADGLTRVRVGDIEVWMDAAFGHLVLYTGDALGPDARRALAVEPMTCATDAFNHPEWGLRLLAPGASAQGAWGIALH
ncbi:MAG TPA: aldose epimerase [Candidatus Thermoplasmatota archaeon]|nr:aldose epimerase [Candidatus Thermoplasmatota archaeon]